jgi:hypothetical protein
MLDNGGNVIAVGCDNEFIGEETVSNQVSRVVMQLEYEPASYF